MDMNNGGIPQQPVSTKKDGKIIAIFILLMAVMGLSIALFATVSNNSDKIAEYKYQIEQKDAGLNETLVSLANYVQQNVTQTIVSGIYSSTNNCSVIAVKYENQTRQLADISCIDKVIKEILEKQNVTTN
jgi:hypothetical protein